MNKVTAWWTGVV